MENIKGHLQLTSIHKTADIKILDDIDNLRFHGISHYVSLPQLVVCGDQSSGKSSVLEAISGVPFPTKDNLCTRFATEVILRRTTSTQVSVSIAPGPGRDVEQAERMRQFNISLESLEQFGDIVEEAKKAMGLASGNTAFCDDVLRVEISGSDRPHLTIVDLPGLIHSENKTQTLTDVTVVRDLVHRYMNNSRSVILAIVSAKNDYANQIVLKLAREVDPRGKRTLGIITKPDTLPVGSESETAFFNLAKNEDIAFKLGWHVLRNRDYDHRHCTSQERDEVEQNFFQNGIWKEMARCDVEIAPLRSRLSKVLLAQIKAELPHLISEIEGGLNESREEFRKLGPSRQNIDEQRMFLLNLGQVYQSITRAAIDGVYEDPYFGSPQSPAGYTKRLRAVIQNCNLEFAEDMRLRGHYYEISSSPKKQSADKSLPILISREKFLDHTKDLLRRSRGRELPGTFNPLIIADLFHEQSQLWKSLVETHVQTVWDAIRSFLDLLMSHLAQDDTADAILHELIDPYMEECLEEIRHFSRAQLDIYAKGHPITYNHYFTETIQNVRASRMEDDLTQRLRKFTGSREGDVLEELSFTKLKKSTLISALSIRNEVDMDRYACSEAIDCMLAFYKVAMKTIVDNIATHGIEKILVQALPHVLSPSRILQMDISAVQKIAQESAESIGRREAVSKRITCLEKGLETCRKHLVRQNVDHYLGLKSIDAFPLCIEDCTHESFDQNTEHCPSSEAISMTEPTEQFGECKVDVLKHQQQESNLVTLTSKNNFSGITDSATISKKARKKNKLSSKAVL